MLSSLFNSSTIPVVEQVVKFTEARHGVLAGNIANLDTPGYRTRDLSPEKFQERLRHAIQAQDEAAISPTYALNAQLAGIDIPSEGEGLDDVSDSLESILYHDDSNVGLEQQVAEITKNQAQHNLAISIMTSQFRLLRAAITERA